MRSYAAIAISAAVLFVYSCSGNSDGDKPGGAEGGESGGGRGGSVKWAASLNDALGSAKSKDKPVMIDFHSERCGWCKVMDKQTYSDAKVISRLEKFVPVKVDADRDYSAVQKYKIAGLPTIVFLSPKGDVIHKVVGYRPPQQFISEMEKVLKKI
jgi:uncharacterized protein YyaL (SSP411 family)